MDKLVGEKARLRAIESVRPDLAGQPGKLLDEGWDSLAIEIGGAWIFKFPRTETAAAGLIREARLLTLLRSRTPMLLPDMVLHRLPVIFSEHAKIPGEMIEIAQYERLDEDQRQAMAEKLARFYASIHAISLADARVVSAGPAEDWSNMVRLKRFATEALRDDLRSFALAMIAAYESLAPDVQVFGHFDGHGWNMAFDHQRGVLNGLYDFADAGIGPLHRDLSFMNFISPDLTPRAIGVYETLTGQQISRQRVTLITAIVRLRELAASNGRPDFKPPGWFLHHVVDWRDFMAAHPELSP